MTKVGEKSIAAMIIMTMAIAPSAVFAAAKKNTALFLDINKSSSFFTAVKYLKENDLVNGYSDGTFHPERKINRSEALAMIMKAVKKKPQTAGDNDRQIIKSGSSLQIILPKATALTIQNSETGEKTDLTDIESLKIDADTGRATLHLRKKGAKKPFTDVNEKDWFFDIVSDAKKLGIAAGNGKYFRPNDEISLAESLRMMFKAAQIKTGLSHAPVPKGIDSNAWYSKDIAYAVEKSIVTQLENGKIFSPEAKLTRGQLTLLIYRFLKVQDGKTFFGYASWYGDGLAKTKLDKNFEFAERFFTAAHKTLPFGTIVRVTNMINSKYVDVVINDRGPYVTGRIIDLSKTAFSSLDSPTVGLIQVQMEPLE